MYVYCVKRFAHIEYYSSRRGAIWFNPFDTVLFKVYSVLYPCCVGVFGMFAVMLGRRLSLVYLQLLRGGIRACMRCACLCLCWVLEWGLC